MDCQTGIGKVAMEWILYSNCSDLSLFLFFCRDTEVHALVAHVSKQLYFLLCLGCPRPAALLTDATGSLSILGSLHPPFPRGHGNSERLMLAPHPGWMYMEFITVQLNESQNPWYFIWMFSCRLRCQVCAEQDHSLCGCKNFIFLFIISIHYVDIGNWSFEVYKWMLLDL